MNILKFTLVAVLLTLDATSDAQEITQDKWIEAGIRAANRLKDSYTARITSVEEQLKLARSAAKFSATMKASDEPTTNRSGKELWVEFANRAQQKFLIDHYSRQIRFLKQQRWELPGWSIPSLELYEAEVGSFGEVNSSITGYRIDNPELSKESSQRLPDWAQDRLRNELQGYSYVKAALTVFQIINPTEMLVKYGDKVFSVEGFDNSGLVDGEKIELTGIFVVSSTRTYPTLLGTNTVFVITPISKETKDRLLGLVDEKLLKRDRMRTWTALSGGFTVVAELVSLDDKNKVILRKGDGSEINVTLSTFIPEDRKYIQDALGP